MNTDTTRYDKNDFLNRLNEQSANINDKFISIKKKAEANDFDNNTEVLKKYDKLKKCIDNLSWKIRHFKDSADQPDQLVVESFNDTIDEISWRIDSVVLAMEGKHLWDAGKGFTRGKHRIKNLS